VGPAVTTQFINKQYRKLTRDKMENQPCYPSQRQKIEVVTNYVPSGRSAKMPR
jgi:hypothetical protein